MAAGLINSPYIPGEETPKANIFSEMALSRVLGFLLLFFVLHAHISEANSIPKPVDILEKAGQFKTVLALLKARHLVKPLNDLLKTTRDGVTLFAPTDKAFNSLPPGTLKKLTPQQQTRILRLHAVPKYYSFSALGTVKNPLPTLAAGLSLNITVKSNKIFVSAGMVTTPVKATLYSKFPLSIFRIDAVL